MVMSAAIFSWIAAALELCCWVSILVCRFVQKGQFLFNDTALASQIPYVNADDPIASSTLSTAQTAGWIWDIGLPTRRGIGHVYSSGHTTEDRAAQELLAYITATV